MLPSEQGQGPQRLMEGLAEPVEAALSVGGGGAVGGGVCVTCVSTRDSLQQMVHWGRWCLCFHHTQSYCVCGRL